MADNKKYYYLKLKEDFFTSDSMVILESMNDGYLYSNILLKMYLKSLKDNGRLMLNGVIPYNSQMLAQTTRHQIGTVERALDIFKQLGLVEVLDSGAIYMLNIQNFVGKSSTEADRKREARARIEAEKLAISDGSGQMSDKRPPEIEIELEKEIEIENRVDYQLIADMYNATCVSFPRLIKLSDKRRKAIKARLRTYTVDDFKKLFELAESSSFLKGQNNRNWSATFDWLIADANMTKVLEGNYADNSSSYRRTTQQAADKTQSDNYAVYQEMYKNLKPSPDDPFQ